MSLTETAFLLSAHTIDMPDKDTLVLLIEGDSDENEFDQLKIKLHRRLHNWRPCVDVTVNDISWDTNDTFTRSDELEWPDRWRALVNKHFSLYNKEHHDVRGRTRDIIGRMVGQRHHRKKGEGS